MIVIYGYTGICLLSMFTGRIMRETLQTNLITPINVSIQTPTNSRDKSYLPRCCQCITWWIRSACPHSV